MPFTAGASGIFRIETAGHASFVYITSNGTHAALSGLSVGSGSKRYYPGTRIGHAGLLQTNVTHDFASIAAATAVSTTVTVTGAETLDRAWAVLQQAGANDLLISAHVQAADTVRVVVFNPTAGAINPANSNLTVYVQKSTV